MKEIWIFMLSYNQGTASIKSVYETREQAKQAARKYLKSLNEKYENTRFWERMTYSEKDEEKIIIYYTNTITFKEAYYGYMYIKRYKVEQG